MKRLEFEHQENKVPPLDMGTATALHFLMSSKNNSLHAIIKYKQKQDPSWSHLNWNAAEQWANYIDNGLDCRSLKDVCRTMCDIFVCSSSVLFNFAAIGRDSLLRNLSIDEVQVFKNGGLIEVLPAIEALLWWDKFRVKKRESINESKTNQGRIAERLTMELETGITSNIANDLKPHWDALNGDYYGYDIRSYRHNKSYSPSIMLIEVKSFSTMMSPIVYITQNEWETAIEAAPNYIFYVWCMETMSHKILPVAYFEKHIPQNYGHGEWQSVKVFIDDWI